MLVTVVELFRELLQMTFSYTAHLLCAWYSMHLTMPVITMQAEWQCQRVSGEN